MEVDLYWLARLLIDFGLVVLILMVQLIVYPTFQLLDRKELHRWHQKYTRAIGVIVMPLMLGQLGLGILFLVDTVDFLNSLNAILIATVWASTFFQFVPIHNRIGANSHTRMDLKNVVGYNWIRVCLWVAILCCSLYAFFS